ncbi:MAG: DNA primase [Cytophagales bacterium]|jgi:DNA primase|nr:DNA primase [Cytophagales bacterium]
MITKEIIETVKDRISIVDIVNSYVELKKRGQSYMACCPFHNENSPSFSVSPRNNIFKCFGCGVSGDTIKFVEKIENVDFVEAIKIIAKYYDIPVIEEENSLNEEQLKIKNAKEIIKRAQFFFCENLHHNNEALNYLKARKINDEILLKFALGYAESQFDSWKIYSENLKFSTQLQIQLGLLSENNGVIHDRFRKRLIFPIFNQYGEAVGFAGRIHENDSTQAKYINSPDSFLYHKSSLLYGLHLAKQAIKEKDRCYLVEGYFDVIMMHQANIFNAISSSGTSLTDGQCLILKKFTNEVVVMYDGDEPGKKSANRAIEKLLLNGFKVGIIILPNDEDPDSFIKKNYDKNIQGLLDDLETDFLTFKINSLKNSNVNDTTEAVRELINLVTTVPDDIYKTLLLQKIKQHLGVQNENLFIQKNNVKKFLFKVEHDPIELLEREIIRLLLLYFNCKDEGVTIGKYILQETRDVNFKNDDHKKILEIISSLPEQQTFNDVFNIVDDKLRSLLIDIVAIKYEISDCWSDKFSREFSHEEDFLFKNVRRTILMLKKKVVREMISQYKEKLKDISDDQRINEILKEITNLKQYEIMIFNEIKN